MESEVSVFCVKYTTKRSGESFLVMVAEEIERMDRKIKNDIFFDIVFF